MRTALRYAFLAALLLITAVAAAAEVPFLTGRVTDNAEVLNEGTRGSLTALLKAHEDSTGDQIAVLTVPSLDGEGIEEYGLVGIRGMDARPERQGQRRPGCRADRPAHAHRGWLRSRRHTYRFPCRQHHPQCHDALLQRGRLQQRRRCGREGHS